MFNGCDINDDNIDNNDGSNANGGSVVRANCDDNASDGDNDDNSGDSLGDDDVDGTGTSGSIGDDSMLVPMVVMMVPMVVVIMVIFVTTSTKALWCQ